MNSRHRILASTFASALAGFSLVLLSAGSTLAQVSPYEIANPKLRAVEETYLHQLVSLQHSIGATQFPLPFLLTRYVGVDPDRQRSLDTRGLEFVYFQNRILLKTSGFYSAAFSSDQLTQNERASRIFQEVVVPTMRLISQEFPSDAGCDGIGFEIAYHVRSPRKNSDFEGREILAVVLGRVDAFAFLNEVGSDQRQRILNRSDVFVDGKPFGLALGQKDSLDVETLGRPDSAEPAPAVVTPASAAAATSPLSITSPGFVPPGSTSAPHAALAAKLPAADLKPAASPADAERLQAQFQQQLDRFQTEYAAKLHLADYAPPTIEVYHGQLVLQLTLRNPLTFEKSTGSIYKRAAQSFDLFLAPQLKGLAPKLPPDLQVDALDFSLLNRLGTEKNSSEAVEFVCPLKSIRSFVEDEITSQDLIDQSVVLVNGVRINLHLEIAE